MGGGLGVDWRGSSLRGVHRGSRVVILDGLKAYTIWSILVNSNPTLVTNWS